MSNYKLTYFNIRGVAEPIRLLFAYAAVPYENNQIDTATWHEKKKTLKWQQVPYLEFDGKVLTQSIAILNYLARKFGLAPEDAWDQAKVDEVIGAVSDMRSKFRDFLLNKTILRNPEKAAELKKGLMANELPLFLGNINELLEEIKKSKGNATTDFVLGGTKPTAADFYLAHCTEQWVGTLEEPKLLDKYPALVKQQKAVHAIPNVAEWIAKRPNASAF